MYSCLAQHAPLAGEFTGKERDSESGLDNFGARYDASSLGRFLSADDPFADQNTSDPQSWNLYAYARNNPLIFTDPSGHDCVYLDNSGGTNPNGQGGASIDHSSSFDECRDTGGRWANGRVEDLSWVRVDPNSDTVRILSHYKDLAGFTLAGPGWSNGDKYANLIPQVQARDEAMEPNILIGAAFNQGPGAGGLSEDEKELAALAEMSGILRDAEKDVRNLGEATAAEADLLGRAWVGPGYRTTGNGGLISRDGKRQYRPPTAKSYGGTWANFESRPNNRGPWITNSHLEIK